MKIRPVGVELFHADREMDGQTDVTKLTVAFRNYANAPQNVWTNNIWKHSIKYLLLVHNPDIMYLFIATSYALNHDKKYANTPHLYVYVHIHIETKRKRLVNH